MKNPRIKPTTIFAAVGLIALATLVTMAYSTNQTTGSPSAGSLSKVILDVGGMSCSGCVSTINSSLAGFEGIDSVQVDVAAGKTEIFYDPRKLEDIGKFAKAITDSGYPAKIVRSVSSEVLEKERRDTEIKSRRAIASAGGIDISRADFEIELAHAMNRYQSAYGQEVFTDQQGKQLLNNLKGQIAQRLVNEGIQLQEIHRIGFDIDPSTVNSHYGAFLSKRGLTRGDFEAELKKTGYSPEYFMKKFRNRALIDTYIDEKVIAGTLNDAEKQRRYADWFANARLLAKVVYFDEEIGRLAREQSAGGGCGSSCSATR